MDARRSAISASLKREVAFRFSLERVEPLPTSDDLVQVFGAALDEERGLAVDQLARLAQHRRVAGSRLLSKPSQAAADSR